MLDIYYGNRTKCVGIVERLSLFKSFSSEKILEIAEKYNHFLSFDKDEIIIEEASKADCFHVLLSGAVRVIKSGSTKIIAKLMPGEVFGEMALLGNRDRSCNVVADEQSITIKVNYKDFSEFDSDIREFIREDMLDSMTERLTSSVGDSEFQNIPPEEVRYIGQSAGNTVESGSPKGEAQKEAEELSVRIREVEDENNSLKQRINVLETSDYIRRSNIIGLRNPYDVLGIKRDTPFAQVKVAYRTLAKKYNPHIVETLGDDVKMMVGDSCKEINLAYSAIKQIMNV
ncbi:MAG: cyclic nucleotide-binding domain-containing protein [Lentisphaeraceae bacterium]|nr:cyclic nucleotide-binding domain-containing protein [Lentisphaeraceae bacterium]